MKIGILGGTFNPIHNAHLEIGKAALEQAGLDKVLFMPNNTPPHKQADLPPDELRIKMIRSAICNNPKFELSLCEIERGGISYMVDTLPLLQNEYPNSELFLIIGGDSYASFNKWYKPDEILKMCKLIVYPRPGYTIDTSNIINLKVEELNISSTDIRNKINQSIDVTDLLPPQVDKIIKDFNLYKKNKA